MPHRCIPLLLLVLLAPAPTSGATTPAPSAPAGSGCALPIDICTLYSYSDAVAMLPTSYPQCSIHQLAMFCLTYSCPVFIQKVDEKAVCSDHAAHSFSSNFREKLTKRGSLLWPVFFCVMSVLFGAIFLNLFPHILGGRIPYTVGLLIVGFILGIVAKLASSAIDCPMYALIYDANGDDLIDEDEYDRFTCKNCDASAICVDLRGFLDAHYPTIDTPIYDATTFRTGSRWSFSFLDTPWKISSLLAEFVSTSGSSHRRRALAASSGVNASATGGDGVLAPDDLWTASCNLFDDMTILKDIDPHLMLVVFLPALLFESACFGVDMGIFRRQLSQIVLLAFPAMILASVMTALCLYALAPTSWTFWVCWLIGIIASATDPVAVVALLKELGAAKTLGTLIEGESLLNDGSAVVLFVWVRNAIGYDYATLAPEWMRGERYTGQVGVELARIVAQMCILGVLIGLAFGWATKQSLRFVYNFRAAEVSAIVGMSYLTFWLAELVMGSSAVLAVVVMGLYMNVNKSAISPKVLHFLHEFYEMVAHFLNTIIFLIAGCKMGAILADAHFHDLFLAPMLPMILLMYPIILFARGFAIAAFFPLLKRLGTGCTWKDAVVMWWGGLRGSVGLALGLAVHHMMYDKHMWGEDATILTDAPYNYQGRGPLLDCRDQPQMVLVLTVVVVFTTVVINGVTMAPLMKLLQMTDVPEDRQYMLQVAQTELAKKTASFIASMREKHEGELKGVNWDVVVGSRLSHIAAAQDHVRDLDRAVWLKVLNMERAHYLMRFEDGRLGSDAFFLLERCMSDLIAAAAIEPTEQLGKIYDQHLDKLNTKLLSNRMPDVSYEAGLAYLDALHAIDHHLKADLALKDPEHVRALRMVHDERTDNMYQVKETLTKLEEANQSIVHGFQCTYVQEGLLRAQQNHLAHMVHEGELIDLDANTLIGEIDKELAGMNTLSVYSSLGSAVSELEENVPGLAGRRSTRVTARRSRMMTSQSRARVAVEPAADSQPAEQAQ